jgi:hypothetical protein
MGMGKPWTDAETSFGDGRRRLESQQIHDSGRFPKRTVEAANMGLSGVD